MFALSSFSTLRLLILLVLSSTLPCSSFTQIPTRVQNIHRQGHTDDVQLLSVAASQTAILDGPNLANLENFIQSERNPPSQSSASNIKNRVRLRAKDDRISYCKIVTGNLRNKKEDSRVVGIAISSLDTNTVDATVEILGDGGEPIFIYEDSMAFIPKSISELDAISTCAASMVGIHCAIHDPFRSNVLEGVGGGEDDFIVPPTDLKEKKVVIMGGGEYACFLADGASHIGASVTQVTTSSIKPRNSAPKISILPPAVGNLGLGFAEAIGKFDCLVDTLSDESNVGDVFNYDDSFVSIDNDGKSVVSLLKEEHECTRYISTMCKSQKIVLDDGIIFGRPKADQYAKQPDTNNGSYIVPPKKFGQLTLQKLLDGNIIYKNKKKSAWIETWSLKDFWEYTSWPRDAAGGANVRFGLPVVDELDVSLVEDDEEDDDEEDIIPASTKLNGRSPQLRKEGSAEQKNPYVLSISGLNELENLILSKEKDCILFLSSSYCRTCKYIKPQYTKLAKDMKESNSGVLMAQVDAGRGSGKKLGKFLNVDFVPSFVLFRAGKVYGDTLSVNRLPSKKMNLAIDLLISGQEWDSLALNELK